MVAVFIVRDILLNTEYFKNEKLCSLLLGESASWTITTGTDKRLGAPEMWAKRSKFIGDRSQA